MPRASNQLQHQSGSSVYHEARGADGAIASSVSLKTLADCVDQNSDTLQVDIVSSAAGGDATAANQVTGNASLATIATNTQPKTPLLNRTEAIPVQIMVGSGGSNYDALRANGQDLMVMIDDMNPDVALNSGLATSSRQDTGNTSLAGILAKQPALGTAGTASADVISVQGIASMTPLVVDGSSSTQPVSGTVAVSSVAGTVAVDGSGVTQPISASSLPLPSGGSTSALQSTGNTSLATIAGDTTSLDGKITACNTGAVVVSSGAITETNSAAILADTTSIDGKITACNTGAVVVASGAITETNSTAILADTASLDGKILTSAPISSNGTTTAQAVNIMGTNDGTNFRTLACGDGGELIMAVHHSWDNTNVLINNVAIAAGAEQLSSEFDLGQGVSHEIGRIEVFVDNSAGVELEVSGGAQHASGGDLYLAADGAVVSSVEEKFTFSQDDVGLSAGHRFMKFNVANKDGSTSTNVTLRVAYYK